MLRRPLRHLTALLLATAVIASACGSDDQQASTPGQPDKVTVGVIPILDVAPIYLGKEKGFFEKHDIDLTLKQAEGGAAVIPP